MAGEIAVVLSTAPDLPSAEALASALLDEGLVACVNLVPGVVSLYRWRGEERRDAEVLLLLKTQRARVPELFERLRALHPYEVPEGLAVWAGDSLPVYHGWVVDETEGNDRGARRAPLNSRTMNAAQAEDGS